MGKISASLRQLLGEDYLPWLKLVQYFAIFDDGHHRQLPRLIRDPFKYNTYAYEYYQKSKPLAKKAKLKQAVIAPSMLYLLYPLNGAPTASRS